MIMMRHALTLALIALFALCITTVVDAETFSFTSSSVIVLAHSVVTDALTSNQLPAAYRVSVGKDGSAVLTGPIMAEIFAQTLIQWNGKSFPDPVTGVTCDYHCAPPKKEFEPIPDAQQIIPVSSQDIVSMASSFIDFSQQQKNTFIARITFSAGYKLTTAQYIVAMAMLIDTAAKNTPIPPFTAQSLGDGKIPLTLAVPAVASPPNWDDTSNPLPLTSARAVEAMQVRMTINGTEVPVPDADGVSPPLPPALSQPFCGAISITIVGSGPIGTMALTLDGKTLCSFDSGGVHAYSLDSSSLKDGFYKLSGIAYNTEGKTALPVVIPIQVQNGRTDHFTPAESSATN